MHVSSLSSVCSQTDKDGRGGYLRRGIYQANGDDELDQVAIVERPHHTDDKAGGEERSAKDVETCQSPAFVMARGLSSQPVLFTSLPFPTACRWLAKGKGALTCIGRCDICPKSQKLRRRRLVRLCWGHKSICSHRLWAGERLVLIRYHSQVKVRRRVG